MQMALAIVASLCMSIPVTAVIPPEIENTARTWLQAHGNDGRVTMENTPILLDIASKILATCANGIERNKHFLEVFGGAGGVTEKLLAKGVWLA